MPIEFQLSERPVGFTMSSARANDEVAIVSRQLLGPLNYELTERLDFLQDCLFSKIPGLPSPARIGDLVVIIHQDLSGLAYCDELPLSVLVKVNRAVKKGETVYLKDISEIDTVKLELTVPGDAALVVVRSFNWKRSLFFDFEPLQQESRARTYNVEKALGNQLALLFGLPSPGAKTQAGLSRIDQMKSNLDLLVDLLAEKNEHESAYQELLTNAPWILGASYSELTRHKKLDDLNIPDFTALRAYDNCRDIIELKQPFLSLFRKNGTFSPDFNDAWNQVERYLDFCQRQRAYLLDAKQLRFENPRCILLIGNNLSTIETNAIRTKESAIRQISVMTYDQLYRNAKHFFDFVLAMADRTYPGND
jgi:Domain of unknown function (DUF4263)